MKKIEFDKKAVIQKNVKIDRDLVEETEAFEKKLSEFGERTKSKYTLTSALEYFKCLFFQ